MTAEGVQAGTFARPAGATIRYLESDAVRSGSNVMRDPREKMNRDQIRLIADRISLLGVIFITTMYIKLVLREEGMTWQIFATSMILFLMLEYSAYRFLGNGKDDPSKPDGSDRKKNADG